METNDPVFSLLQKMLVGSLLLHAGAFLWVNQHSVIVKTPPDKQNIAVILTNRLADDQLEKEIVEELVETQPIEAGTQNQVPSNIESSLTETVSTEADALVESPQPEDSDLNENIADDAVQAGISTQVLSSSISSYLTNNRTQLNRESIEACLRYQNKHGAKDCPNENSATYSLVPEYVLHSESSTRRNNDLLDQMDDLRVLMEKNPVMGELAASQYYFNRDLYGGATNSMLGSTMNNAIAGDRVLGLVGTSGGIINSLLGGEALRLEFSNNTSDNPENYVETSNVTSSVETFEMETPILMVR